MSELPQTTEVAIIGGGVIGLAVARSLRMRGVRDVMVIERGSLGAESSGAAAGMLAPQAEANSADEFFHLCRRSRDLYSVFAGELLEETGLDIQLETTGTLYLALNDKDVKELERRYDWQSRSGLAVERLSAASAKTLEPSISEHIRLALLFPLDSQVENRLLIKALAASNQHRGVRLATDTLVNSVRLSRGRIAGLETSRGFVAVENLVIAAGAWSSRLSTSDESREMSPDSELPGLGIEPVRGQMLCLESSPGLVSHVIYSPRGYVVPRCDGRLLAGSTTEHVGFDKSVTDEGAQSIYSAAAEISPLIGSFRVKESWAGLRPRAPDGLPVLGAYAEIAGLFYATGHYRNGILLAPVTGEIVAGAIVDRVSLPELDKYSPNRFGMVTAN